MKGFIPFVILGDPNKEISIDIIKALINAGADGLELGFPFSDPMLDGPVIQKSHKRAMMFVDECFGLIKQIRTYSHIPISIMTSYNLVYQRPTQTFYNDANDAGANFVLIPDIPLEESKEVLNQAKSTGLGQVSLISPDTSTKRIRKINKEFNGYMYLVSLLGITGNRDKANSQLPALIKRVKSNSTLPVCVGFGISNPQSAAFAIEHDADGVITGTPICEIISKHVHDKETMLKKIRAFTQKMSAASKQSNSI